MGDCCSTPESQDNSLQRNLVRERKQDFHEVYDVVGLIGEGSISNIYKIVKKEDQVGGSANKFDPVKPAKRTRHGEIYALKEIDLRFVEESEIDELRNEINLLKELDHPNIIRAYETFLYKKKLSMVLELCTGGDLYKRHPYTEVQAASIIRQVLLAINYMHNRNIMHKDIKYENIMFENDKPNAKIKLIDFGLAAAFRKNQLMTERVGTVYTMSPEVMDGIYTSKADLWSVGVVSYMLLSGIKPFWGDTRQDVIDAVRRGKYNFKGKTWKGRSQEGKSFVSALLKKDPNERLSASQALEHKWLDSETVLSSQKPDLKAMGDAQVKLVQYAESGEFKKLVLNVIAKKSTAEDIMELRDMFYEFDADHDGTITLDEFKTAMSKSNLSNEEIECTFNKMDVDKNRKIMYTEFIASVLETRGRIDDARLADAFDQLDSDGRGYISKANLRKILGSSASNEYVNKLIKEADFNNDGQISYEEFRQYIAEKYKENVNACVHAKPAENVGEDFSA